MNTNLLRSRAHYADRTQYKDGVDDDKSECWALIRTYTCLKWKFRECRRRAALCDPQEVYNMLIEVVRRGKEQCKGVGDRNWFEDLTVVDPFF